MKAYKITPYLSQIIVRPLIRGLLNIFCNLEVRGQENIKGLENGFILASNHIHEFDSVFIPSSISQRVLPSPVFFTSLLKKYYKDNRGWRGRLFYGGAFFKILGAYPVYIGLKNYRKSLINHIEILEDENPILIFPEGKVTEENKIQKAKGGVGFLAGYTQSPVVPIRIEGIWKMNMKDLLFKKRTLRIMIGEPIYSRELFDNSKTPSPEKSKEAANKIMNSIKNLSWR